MTDVRVVAAHASEKGTLQNLFQLYAHDFSEIIPLEVDAFGRFKEPALDPYWADPKRSPFLLWSGEHLAGFALVERRSRLSGADDVWDMADFFVLRRHRRLGVGMAAAHRIFSAHPGKWEVRERKANVAATSFWRRAISAHTNDAFTEEELDDERWRGPVQFFTALANATPATNSASPG